MRGFSEFLAEQLQDPEVKREYNALETEYFVKQAIVNRKNADKTDIIRRDGGNRELS